VRSYRIPDRWGTAFCGTCGSPVRKLHPGGDAIQYDEDFDRRKS